MNHDELYNSFIEMISELKKIIPETINNILKADDKAKINLNVAFELLLTTMYLSIVDPKIFDETIGTLYLHIRKSTEQYDYIKEINEIKTKLLQFIKDPSRSYNILEHLITNSIDISYLPDDEFTKEWNKKIDNKYDQDFLNELGIKYDE